MKNSNFCFFEKAQIELTNHFSVRNTNCSRRPSEMAEKKKTKSSKRTKTETESFHENLETFSSSTNANETESGNFDVIVVGAGFAGLSAARELAQSGFSVVVVEAR